MLKLLGVAALLLQAGLSPASVHATPEAGAIPAPPKDPGAAETQIFWQQRNRDHLILQQRTLSNQITIYDSLKDRDPERLKKELGAFCASAEGTDECLKRYKRATARQLEDIKGALLRSEDQITQLRSDVPGQGGHAVERGGAISAPDESPETRKDHTVFNARSKNPTELLGPAYVPTLEELDARARAFRAKQSTYTSNEERYETWSQNTFSKVDARSDGALNENYALFQAVKPSGANGGGEAPLRRIQTQRGAAGGETILVDQEKKAQAIQSLEQHASRDKELANQAKKGAIESLQAKEAKEINPGTQLKDKYTKSEIDALNLARGEIIQAYTSKLAETQAKAPKASPSGKPSSTPAARLGTPPEPETETTTPGGRPPRRTTAGNPATPPEVTAEVSSKGKAVPSGAPVSEFADHPLYNERPVEGQLLEPKDYHIYMDPAGIDEQIEELRE